MASRSVVACSGETERGTSLPAFMCPGRGTFLGHRLRSWLASDLGDPPSQSQVSECAMPVVRVALAKHPCTQLSIASPVCNYLLWDASVSSRTFGKRWSGKRRRPIEDERRSTKYTRLAVIAEIKRIQKPA